MGKKIGLGLLAVIGVFLIYVAAQPSHFVVSREIAVNAPVDKVFPYVNNRTLANSWNPWLKQDPTAKVEVSGPETGVGAKTSWDGGKDLGTGSATVTESVLNERVLVKLEYLKPFNMTQDAAYMLKTVGNQTIVTWQVEGNNSFIGRIFCTFMNMDKMVGGTFEKGLAEMKTMIEGASK